MARADSLADPTPARPVLKWAGGKRQLVDKLLALAPTRYNKYIEPFLGGGAMFFALSPSTAILADSNAEIVHFYNILARHPSALIAKALEYRNTEHDYYRIRALEPHTLDPICRAARTLYLNRTCFNGLYRVNRNGQFNTPYGHYRRPSIYDIAALYAASAALRPAQLSAGDYCNTLRENAASGDFVYLDPPYIPVSEYSDFRRYTAEPFTEQDHVELASCVSWLSQLGCHTIITNSNHPLVHSLYANFQIIVCDTARNINSVGNKRSGQDVIIVVPPRCRG